MELRTDRQPKIEQERENVQDMITEIRVEDREYVSVKDAGIPKGELIEIRFDEDLRLLLSKDKATAIYEGIEQAMWDESEWSTTLRDEVDRLRARVEELEEQIEDLESETEKDHISNSYFL